MTYVYDILKIVSYIIFSLLPLVYLSQVLSLIVSMFTKPKKYKESKKLHNFGYIICARNEENVIDKLIDSIKKQDYPQELMHIFVICDNCTDNTKKIAQDLGCYVIERNNLNKIGKGYALDYGIKIILNEYNHINIDAFFVFDADNLLTKNYTKEMNKLYSENIKVATSYRNSINFDKNCLTSASGLMFLRECEIIHKARVNINIGTYVSGTGFYVDKTILKDLNGWPFYTLIEDIEFSCHCAKNNIKIGYAHDAIFYDEQTEKNKDTFNQRLRWCKGNIQCFKKDWWNLIKNFFKKGNLTCMEMFSHTIPIPAITLIWSVIYVISLVVLGIINQYTLIEMINSGINEVLMYYLFLICVLYIQGAYTIISARKRIKCNGFKLLVYSLFFPIYVLYLSFIMAISLFAKVSWKSIKHVNKKSINEMES